MVNKNLFITDFREILLIMKFKKESGGRGLRNTHRQDHFTGKLQNP